MSIVTKSARRAVVLDIIACWFDPDLGAELERIRAAAVRFVEEFLQLRERQ
jgi:hypothetical protein